MDQLFKIQHEFIAAGAAEAWYVIATPGTTFHYRWGHGTKGGEPYSQITDEHSQQAVCREEPSLTMAWGIEVHDRLDRRGLHFEWASHFTNRSVTPFWVDFFWNNALIDRVELARVDGGHGVIPIPDYELRVSEFEVAVAFLVHALGRGADHDNPGRYLDRIGAKRVPDDERGGAGSPR